MEPQMIDWHRINELRTEIGAEDFVEVAQIFLEELGDAVRNLQTQPAPVDVAERLHFIKGCALNLGFAAVAETAAAAERAPFASTDDLALTLASRFAASQEEFVNRLTDSAAA